MPTTTTRSTRAPRAAKRTESRTESAQLQLQAPPKTRKRKVQQQKAVSEDEYELSEVAETASKASRNSKVSEPERSGSIMAGSQSMEQFERKVKELKSKAAASTSTKHYGEKFAQQSSLQIQEAINVLSKQRDTILKSSTSTAKKIDSFLSCAVDTTTTDLDQLVENHPLSIYSQSLLGMIEQFTSIHHPLQDALRYSLENELLVGQQWAADGKDAMDILCRLRDDAQTGIVVAMEESEDNEGWAEVVKRSKKGVRRMVRTAGLPAGSEGEGRENYE
ncbi:hypothetical protein FPQ18DRAFT_404403 [Pyronema domesticum]|uniref:Uncharacterized protein n=1 Tax=Pyronema omphalodes (strain CBS 100304) TaxID=1076935 RepID=U4LJ61_PYROM|nr:hypothetical protein FPQ18DRAFT_404403 [Pyronema domesticum]CCX32134.1 Protein of unknown function [Pyronema omphalodes CBS 100304]